MNRVLWAIIGVGTVAMAIGAIALFQFANGGGSDDTPSEAGEGVAPRTKNELRLLGADPPTMDPALTTDATSARYIVEIFSGLVTINRDLQIAPDLAKSWEVSADGKVYTFKLREDAAFHNGQPVKAQTVKDSLERAADSANAIAGGGRVPGRHRGGAGSAAGAGGEHQRGEGDR